MARFKKKKSAPTKGKDESTKQPPGDGVPKDGPAEEPKKELVKAPPAEDPKGDPPIDPEQQGEKDSKLNRLFWMRVGFALVAGVAATFIFDSIEGEERRWASIAFMIIVFGATIIIGKGMRIPFSLSDRKKIVTQGIGSYVFIYLFMWIVSYTLVNLGNAESQVPFP